MICRSLKTDCSILFGLGAIIALLFGTVQISRSSGGGFAGQVTAREKGRRKRDMEGWRKRGREEGREGGREIENERRIRRAEE